MEMCMYLDKAALSQEKKHAVGIGKQVRAGMSGTAIQHLTKQQAQSSMGAPAIHTVAHPRSGTVYRC